MVVHLGDFEFTASRRLHFSGDIDNFIIIHIQASDGEVRLRVLWFLFDSRQSSGGVKYGDTVTLWVFHLIAKECCTVEMIQFFLQQFRQPMAVEDVVSQRQADRVRADEVAADDEGFGEPVWVRLLGVVDLDAEFGALAEEALEQRKIVGGRDQQDLADARQHLCGQRVINHGLVVHRHQLFADGPRDGVKPAAAAAREDDSFHEAIS